MKYGLGIDAGGTYTDAVIYDFRNQHVTAFSKAITNKEDLKQGIDQALDQLPRELLREVSQVSLSTTLATNACVEGKGQKSTLVLMGCNKNTVSELGIKYGLPSIENIIFIDGRHGDDGNIRCEVNWEDLKEKILNFKDKTNAFAIVEISGNYNPEFEIEAKKIAKEATGLYAVGAYEVSRELNFMKRAASALINAQTIPLINEFLDAVKVSLKVRDIDAELVIVRGDGSLMSEAAARETPVETMLSGPAASVMGAVKLSGMKSCMVVDMGGTTSDLALVKDGRIKFAHKGIQIGRWQTGTKSIMVKPVGLGGDSHITFHEDNIVILPSRVVPLCWLVHHYPHCIVEMQRIYEEKKKHTKSLCEFFLLIKDVSEKNYLEAKEKDIVVALREGPLSLKQLSETVGQSIYELKLDDLERQGIIMRSALTPTDIMHIVGAYNAWNTEGADLGAAILADRLRMGVAHFITKVNNKVKQKLYLNIVQTLLEDEGNLFEGNPLSEQALELLIRAGEGNLLEKDQTGRNASLKISSAYGLVGIGAPIHVFLPEVAKMLNTSCCIPEYAAVANALGAVTGDVAVDEQVIIKPEYTISGIDKYHCFSSLHHMEFANYIEAVIWAKEVAAALAKEKAISRGAGEVSIVTDIHENNFRPKYDEVQPLEESSPQGVMLLETVVTARAIGMVQWI